MDLTYKQEVGVGAFVLVGVAVFLIGMFYLTGRSLGTSGLPVDVLFESVAGLKQGDPVLVSGVKKGRVARVALERVKSVRVTIEIQRDVAPHIDASAAVAAMDLFGAKFIDYNPGSRDEMLAKGRAIAGSNQPDITDVAQGVANRANELMENAANIVSDRLGEHQADDADAGGDGARHGARGLDAGFGHRAQHRLDLDESGEADESSDPYDRAARHAPQQNESRRRDAGPLGERHDDVPRSARAFGVAHRATHGFEGTS